MEAVQAHPGSLTPTRAHPATADEWRQAPKIELEPDSVYTLAKQGLRQRTIADILRVSLSYFEGALAKEGPIRNAYYFGRGAIEMDIMQAQIKYALAGDSKLLVMLGQHHAGQRNLKAVELSGPDGGPISANVDIRGLILQKLSEHRRNRGVES